MVELLVIFCLILLNGVFSMSEIALVSARKARLDSSAKKGNSNAKAALNIANAPNRFFSTVQIGITLIGILIGIFSGEGITSDLENRIQAVSFLKPYAHSIAVSVVVVVITFFSLVFGELVPKRIGLTNPEKIAKLVARPMNVLTAVTAPFVWLLTFTTDMIIKLFGIKPGGDNRVTEEEIKAIIQEGTTTGAIQEIEQDIVERVFHLGDRKITSLMTHRNEMVFIESNTPRDEVRNIVGAELHSIYPVYESDRDNVIGVTFLKDLFTALPNKDFTLKKHIKQPQFIIESATAYQTLEIFKTSRVHYGLVMDEYGQIQGIVTMNDILEALVGGASLFNSDECKIQEREDGTWLIDGHYPYAEFLHYFDLDIAAGDYSFNTMGGLILHLTRSIPRSGRKVKWRHFEFEVVDMDGIKIDKILIREIGEED